MRNKFIFTIMLMFILVLSVSFASASLTTDIVSYYKLDENTGTNASDSHGSNDGTINGATWTTGKINYGLDFDGTNDYVSLSNSFGIFDGTSNGYSYGGWIKFDDITPLQIVITFKGEANIEMQTANLQETILFYTGHSALYTGTLSDNTWYHIIGTYDTSTGGKLYVNGILVDSDSTTGSIATRSGNNALGVADDLVNRFFNGIIDEVAIYNKSLTQAEVTKLYNSGAGLQYPFTNETTNYLNITAIDSRDSSAINTFNITLQNGTTYSTTNGTINTGLYNTTLNFTAYADDYYNITYTDYNTSSDLELSFNRTKYNITFVATDLNNNTVTDFNVTLENGTVYTNGTYEIYSDFENFTFSKTDYYNSTLLNQSIDSDKNLTFTNVYNAILNLTFKDILDNNTINSSGYFIYNGTNVSTTNGTFSIPLMRGEYINTTSKATNYAYLYESFNITDLFTEISFYLYAENSIWITAKDLNSLSTLDNITVTLYNSFNVYKQTNDTVRINNITSGTYNVKIEKPEYTTVYYIVTIGSGSHQNLLGYLSKTTTAITFTTKDITSSALLEEVTVSIYYLINSSWNLINSKDTDVTGRVQFNVDTSNTYKFEFTKTGYTTKSFLLEPVFTEYTIKLSSSETVTADTDKGDYYVRINPYLVYEDQINNISFDIVSGTGTFEYYNITIKSQVDSKGGNYSSTYGGSYLYALNVSDSELGDTVNVTYGVKEVGESYKTYNVLLTIQDENINEDNTFYGLKESLSGYGYFEKSIIATIIMLMLLGVIATITHLTGGNTFIITGISLLVFTSLFVTIDFIPVWGLYIVGFSFLLLMFAKLRGE